MTKGERLKVLLDVQRRYNLPHIDYVYGRRNRCSVAGYHFGKNRYRISQCAYWERYGDEAVLADLLHELCHIVDRVQNGRMSHGPKFRALEKQLLSEYGLVPKNYKTAYYRRLETANGKIIYDLK